MAFLAGKYAYDRVSKNVKYTHVFLSFTMVLCIFVVAIAGNSFAILGRYDDGYANMDDDTLGSVKGMAALSVFSLMFMLIMAIMYGLRKK